MSIRPVCDKCRKELEDFGGILLSPPDEDNNVKKFHLCKKCCKKVINSFDEHDSDE